MPTTAKKTSPKAPVAAGKKVVAKKKVNKGETLSCEVCGVAVVVDEIGDYGYAEESVILCCGKPMKQKAAKSKAAATKAVKK
jgi:hypothetical protein